MYAAVGLSVVVVVRVAAAETVVCPAGAEAEPPRPLADAETEPPASVGAAVGSEKEVSNLARIDGLTLSLMRPMALLLIRRQAASSFFSSAVSLVGSSGLGLFEASSASLKLEYSANAMNALCQAIQFDPSRIGMTSKPDFEVDILIGL